MTLPYIGTVVNGTRNDDLKDRTVWQSARKVLQKRPSSGIMAEEMCFI